MTLFGNNLALKEITPAMSIGGISYNFNEYTKSMLDGAYVLGNMKDDVFTCEMTITQCRDAFLQECHNRVTAGREFLEFVLFLPKPVTSLPWFLDHNFRTAEKIARDVEKYVCSVKHNRLKDLQAVYVKFPTAYYIDPIVMWMLTNDFRVHTCGGLSRVDMKTSWYATTNYVAFHQYMFTYAKNKSKLVNKGILGNNSPELFRTALNNIAKSILTTLTSAKDVNYRNERYKYSVDSLVASIKTQAELHPNLVDITFPGCMFSIATLQSIVGQLSKNEIRYVPSGK